MNRVIFPFKLFPGWDKPEDKDPAFWELADLVVTQANKFYQTVLVCDEYTKSYFEGKLPFNKIEISKGIREYEGNSYCIPKLKAIIEQTEPYIMLDLDSVLLKPLPTYLNIAFGFAEINMFHPGGVTEGTLQNTFNLYFQKHELDKIKTNLPGNMVLKWDKIPNSSLVYVPEPQVLSDIYSEILEDHLEAIEEVSPMMVEQFLVIQYLNHSNHRVNWVQSSYGEIHESYYLHWDKYNKGDNILKLLRERYMSKPLI